MMMTLSVQFSTQPQATFPWLRWSLRGCRARKMSRVGIRNYRWRHTLTAVSLRVATVLASQHHIFQALRASWTLASCFLADQGPAIQSVRQHLLVVRLQFLFHHLEEQAVKSFNAILPRKTHQQTTTTVDSQPSSHHELKAASPNIMELWYQDAHILHEQQPWDLLDFT